MRETRLYRIHLLAIAMGFPLAAHADLLGDCSAVASEINSTTPQQLDKATTLLNTVCVRSGREVVLIYRNEVKAPAGAIDQQRLNTVLKPKILQAWCTDPVERRTLNLLNIRYTYNGQDGRYIGKPDITRQECN